MKKLLSIVTLLLLVGCSYNRTYQNRKSDQNEAEEITKKFYYALTYGNPADADKLFSAKFFEATPKDKLAAFIDKSKNDDGKITEYELKDSQTLVVEGTNAKSEYILKYDVKREKNPTIETISMIKENGVIKIVGYNVMKNF